MTLRWYHQQKYITTQQNTTVTQTQTKIKTTHREQKWKCVCYYSVIVTQSVIATLLVTLTHFLLFFFLLLLLLLLSSLFLTKNCFNLNIQHTPCTFETSSVIFIFIVLYRVCLLFLLIYRHKKLKINTNLHI